MSVKTSWFGDDFLKRQQRHEMQNMQRAVRFGRNAIIRNIGIKWPPPSKPGEMPHLRTGMLRNSFTTEVVVDNGKVTGRIGTAVKYAKYLELPAYGLDRAFIVPTMEAISGDITKILANPL